MHAWDMAIANRLNESLNLGFDTLTKYPDASSGGTTVDGSILALGFRRSFSDIRAGGTSKLVQKANSVVEVSLYADDTSNTYNAMGRGLMTFDTSSIGSSKVVDTATLSVYGTSKANGLGSAAFHISTATPAASNNIEGTDWPNFYSDCGNVSYASYTTSYNDVTLNATGEANVNMAGISRFGARLSWDQANSFTGSWATYAESKFLFYSADQAGTSNDPKLVVTYHTSHNKTIDSSIDFSTTTVAQTTHNVTVASTISFDASLNAQKIIAPIAGKEYVYRVYSAAGAFIGVWNDVADEPEFSQRLNTPGTTTTVRLARSGSRTIEIREQLTDQTADPLTTEDDIDLIVAIESNNTVGEDTDVDLNYNVDIYAHYGAFEELTTEDEEFITAEDGESLIVAVGAPLGRRIFSGFIMDYSATYGVTEYVVVTLASHGFELSHEIIKDGTNTTRAYSSQNHDVIIKSILDTNPGTMSYDASSIASPGVTISETFRLNTKLEGIESVYNQSPEGWYWFGDVGENLVYLQEAATEADHLFVFGKHIREISLSRTIEDLRNEVWFIGGDTGSGILYKKYEDATSQSTWRKGVHRITDRRFTVAASAQKVSEKVISRYKDPIYTTTVSIPSEVYDIETIRLGQMVGFGNFGNFVDSVLLQVVSINYTPRRITLDLGELLQRQQDIVDKLANDVEGEQYIDIPNAPA
jgi:hypothetical protein